MYREKMHCCNVFLYGMCERENYREREREEKRCFKMTNISKLRNHHHTILTSSKKHVLLMLSIEVSV